MARRILSGVLAAAMAFGVAACREEGAAEKAGRKFDEAVEKLRHGDEGPLEKAGRKFDEKVEEFRESAADAVEGDED
jgi:hypothetical protein